SHLLNIFAFSFILSTLICFTHLEVNARPVSYPGGWTIIQMNDMHSNSVNVHYSSTARSSIGYRAEYWREEEWQFHGLQYNYLMHRINNRNSQANFYFKTGAGLAYSDYEELDSQAEAAGFAGISFDFEDRRYFVSYENRGYYAGDIDEFFMQKARIGITPYIGDYSDLHSWLMLEIGHNTNSDDDDVTITPLIRFFKGKFLAEAGVSDDGDVMFNWIVRF
ncbi:MAG: hypothetical protein AAF195_04770, partial [Pseudomonadota bacterium]